MVQRRTLIKAIPALALSPALAFAEPSIQQWDRQFDVVVLGAGGAGLAAALTAAGRGLSVVVYEKADNIGGDTLNSSGFFNAAGLGKVADAPKNHAEEMLALGGGLNDPELVRTFTERCPEALRWLESLGMQFESKPYKIYGTRQYRSYRPHRPRGTGYIHVLGEACLKAGVVIQSATAALNLYQDPETRRVLGVQIAHQGERIAVRARRGVVLATGGFGANHEMLRQHAPAVASLEHDSAIGATGDGHLLAERAGAELVNMKYVEIVPGGPVSIAHVIRLDIYPDRMIMVNARGERFVDERSDRGTLGEAILSQPDGIAYTLADDATVASSDILDQKYLYQALHAGVVMRAKNVAGLARKLSVPERALEKTVKEACMRSRAGAPCRPILRKPPYWAQKIELHIHVTLGGVKINSSARVLDAQNNPIAGLFAAGGIVGNLHGAVRLGGNGVSSAIVFGRIAGQSI